MADDQYKSGGIYDDFPGYRHVPERELAIALRSALVVVDANVLLNLYRYNESTRDDLIRVLTHVGDRLWVPHQVLREFWRNRLGVLASRGVATKEALDALGKQQKAASDAIGRWAKALAVDSALQDQLVSRVGQLYHDLERRILAHTPAAPKGAGAAKPDAILSQLQGLLDGKAGKMPDAAEWQAQVKEGNDRVARRVPPGYLDSEKSDSTLPEGAAGDYLVWRQATDEAARRGLDLLLVTGDEKEDWWWRYRSEFLGPRVELVSEFKARCGRQLYMMRPTDLLNRASALDLTVRKESVDDAERVSRESQQPGDTTAEVLAKLIAYGSPNVQAAYDGLQEAGYQLVPSRPRSEGASPQSYLRFIDPDRGEPATGFLTPTNFSFTRDKDRLAGEPGGRIIPSTGEVAFAHDSADGLARGLEVARMVKQ